MKSKNLVKTYFKSKGWDFDEKKPKDADVKWEDIGKELNISGDAARNAHLRHRLELAQSLISVKVKEDSFMEELDRVEFVEDLPVNQSDTFSQVGQHLVLGCVHVPFTNQVVLDKIYQLMSDINLVGLHIIGDFMDMNTLSSHDRGRFAAVPGLTLDSEYAEGNKVLDKFDSLLPKGAVKSYLYGNHEDRYLRWMADMQNSKTPLQSPKQALRLLERGYSVKTSWQQDYFTLGKHLEILHGVYFNVHTAKKHIDTLRGSVMFAHTHRIQSYIEGFTGGFNIGWLGDVNSPAFGYASRAQKAQWQNGFAIVNIDEDGDYFVEQVIVCNDKFVYGGKLY